MSMRFRDEIDQFELYLDLTEIPSRLYFCLGQQYDKKIAHAVMP